MDIVPHIARALTNKENLLMYHVLSIAVIKKDQVPAPYKIVCP
jgi:hypothetical protein